MKQELITKLSKVTKKDKLVCQIALVKFAWNYEKAESYLKVFRK